MSADHEVSALEHLRAAHVHLEAAIQAATPPAPRWVPAITLAPTDPDVVAALPAGVRFHPLPPAEPENVLIRTCLFGQQISEDGGKTWRRI